MHSLPGTDGIVLTPPRRLVVVNQAGELVGIFALDDMLELLGEELTAISGLLRAVSSRHA